MKTIQKLVVAAVAIVAMTACCQNDKPKFDAKEYAERKTERLDKIVDLTDAQEKEVYSLYLAQGKEIKKNIKAAKKECGDMKRPDCKKAEGCPKANCDKPCPEKAEGCKPCCDKAECKKAECCDKAKCDKPCPPKPECGKPCCDKAKCDKPCPEKAECGKPMRHNRPHRHSMVSPELRKATIEKIGAILTPEQSAKLKERHAKRHACCPNGKQCVPTPSTPAVEK